MLHSRASLVAWLQHSLPACTSSSGRHLGTGDWNYPRRSKVGCFDFSLTARAEFDPGLVGAIGRVPDRASMCARARWKRHRFWYGILWRTPSPRQMSLGRDPPRGWRMQTLRMFSPASGTAYGVWTRTGHITLLEVIGVELRQCALAFFLLRPPRLLLTSSLRRRKQSTTEPASW